MNIGVFDNILEKDESLEWVGKPEPFAVIDASSKKSIQIKWIIWAAVAVVLNALYIGFSLGAGLFEFKAFALVVTFGVPIYFCLVPFIDRNILLKRKYAITSKRVIIYAGETNIHSMAIDSFDGVRVVETDGGKGHIAIGSKIVKAPAYKLRGIALSPKTETKDDKDTTIAMVLYNIAGVNKVKALLSGKTKANG